MEFQHYSGHSEIEKVVVSERTLEGVKMSLGHFMGRRFVKATNLISEKKELTIVKDITGTIRNCYQVK
jgi:hypothetical protein